MYSERVAKLLEENSIAVGNTIRVHTKDADFEGVLMPRPELGNDDILILKLSNGCNIGIQFGKLNGIEKLGSEKKSFAFPKTEAKANPKLPKLNLIYTGGTIGSKVDYSSGGVYMLTKPEELLYDVPELAAIANVEAESVMSIASEDMTYHEWQIIAKKAADALNKGSRGIVITHGTDTLHYTSAALSFMLQNPNAPVVLTGSQRSPDRGSSDAFMNLICSAHFATKGNAAEVGICMHSSMADNYCDFIRGTKVRKMHTSRRDAFKPVNNVPIARIAYDGAITYMSEYTKDGKAKNVKAKTDYEPRVALVKLYPNFDPGMIDYYTSKKYKGMIIEGTGLGHGPVSTGHKEYNILGSIKGAVDSGMVVGMTSQCLFGRVNDKVYRNLRLIRNAGVIYCEDMMPETAYVKLGWLLGNYKKDEAAKLLSTNLIGEITERSEIGFEVC